MKIFIHHTLITFIILLNASSMAFCAAQQEMTPTIPDKEEDRTSQEEDAKVDESDEDRLLKYLNMIQPRLSAAECEIKFLTNIEEIENLQTAISDQPCNKNTRLLLQCGELKQKNPASTLRQLIENITMARKELHLAKVAVTAILQAKATDGVKKRKNYATSPFNSPRLMPPTPPTALALPACMPKRLKLTEPTTVTPGNHSSHPSRYASPPHD